MGIELAHPLFLIQSPSIPLLSRRPLSFLLPSARLSLSRRSPLESSIPTKRWIVPLLQLSLPPGSGQRQVTGFAIKGAARRGFNEEEAVRRGIGAEGRQEMSPLGFPTVNLKDRVSSLPVYFDGEEADPVVAMRKQSEFGLDGEPAAAAPAGEEEEASSSIGSASSSGSVHGEEEEEVESKRRDGTLGSLDSLEDALPVKRGLSNFFSGKSKSFASLADVAGACAKDVAKPENPFNKRRRVQMMSKMRRASYTSLLCPPLPSLLSPTQTVEEADEEEEEEEHIGSALGPFPSLAGGGFVGKRPFRSPRSFSLSDLRHHA